MAFMFKLVSVLIVSSIVSDFTNLGGRWFNSDQYVGDIRFTQSHSLIFPGADARPDLETVVAQAIVQEIAKEILTGEKKDKGG